MKKLLFFLSLSLLIISCQKDDDDVVTLRHDSGLNAAPFLLAGEYILASRYTANDLSSYQSRKLDGVQFYLQNTPNQCEVRVYSGSNGDEPGSLVYSENVTVDMTANSWNEHLLSTPVDITGDDLWIAVWIRLNAEEATVGCDVGPAVTNGDWISSDTDNLWTTYRDFTSPQVSINWNIRGIVSEWWFRLEIEK